MVRTALRFSALLLASATLFVSGCGVAHQSSSTALIPAGRQGVVHGGQQPVTGATIQLYAVGTTGDGSAATPLLSPAPTTDANGGFTLTGAYTCPSSTALVYLVATGGNPGLSGGTTNPNLAMMAALGPCGSLSATTFIVVNELTTVGAVYALAPFMLSPSAIGSASGDAAALSSAFTLASELVNTATGTAPGTGVPTGTIVPTMQINLLGDILAACVNSAGGTAGDSSSCGNLFTLTTPTTTPTTPPATNTILALLNLANNPALNTPALASLPSPASPFQPIPSVTPSDLAVRLLVPSNFTVSPAVLTFPATRVGSVSAPQTITFTNNTASPVGLDLVVTTYQSPDLTGNNPSDFATGSGTLYNCPTPVMPGATCTVQFAFTPTATGSRSAELIVNNTSANPVIGIPLLGEGLEATAGPAALSATPPIINSTLTFTAAATPTAVTLTNSGSTPLTIDGISISNDPTSGVPAFSQTNTCGTSLAALSACTITISALATSQVSSTGILTVADDAADGPQTLNLSYLNGISSPIKLDFGSRSVGTTGTGNINGIPDYPNSATLSLGGPDAADFTVTDGIPPNTTVCTGSRFTPTCGSTITFTPSATGTRTATLYVNGIPYGGVVGVGLPAGVQFETVTLTYVTNPTPINSLNFNLVSVGNTSTIRIGVLNTGTLSLTLNTPVLSGPNPSDFSVTASTCPSALAPNGFCTIDITAAPSQPTNRSATLTESTGGVQQALSLKVLGANPAPSANPNTLTFPYTPAGTVSASQSFTISSYNNDPVSMLIQDGSLLPFVLTGAGSCTATPCSTSVAFAPTSSGSGNAYANLIIKDLYTSQYFSVRLSGALAPPPVTSWTVSPAMLTFVPQTVGTTSAVQNITLSNTGNQTIDFSILQSGYISYTDFSTTNGCSGVVLAGANCTIGVKFTPAGTGTRPYTLQFSSNAPTSPDLVTLTGTGQ